MVDVRKLRGRMAEKGFTQKELAMKIGINDKTLGRKMKTGCFGIDEMNSLIKVLDIENPAEIFFANM